MSSLTAQTKMSTAQAKEARQKMIAQARTYIGTPYVSGGTNENGMDCSGLIYTVTREAIGLQFSRTVAQQYAECSIIKDDEKEAGDLVFFKTVGDRISHVGLYVGNSQFIHSASDGPNTGVIMSSLNESYWKQHYYCVGRFLPSGKTQTVATEPKQESQKVAETTGSSSSAPFNIRNLLADTSIDMTAALMTTMITRQNIMLTVRGFDASATVLYTKGSIQPGLGLGLRYDTQTHLFQIPVTATIATSQYLRFYIGPVFSMGTAVMPGDMSQNIASSFFPGIIGLSWQTPSFTSGSVGLRLTGDTSYVVYNNTDGAALPFLDSIIAGFTFNVGFRVTLPRF